MILFWWTFLSFQNTANSNVSGHTLKYMCLLSLLSYFCMSFIAAMIINNLVTQHLSLGMCRIIYPLYFIFYNIGKISTYCLVSFRQQVIFSKDLYSDNLATSPVGSQIYRILSICLPSIFWALFIYFGYNHIEIITIPNPGAHNEDYIYCYMQTFEFPFYAQSSLAMIGILDAFFRFWTLTTFISKSIAVTTYYSQHLSKQKRDIITRLTDLMKKTNLLDITSIICTLSFLLCSAFVFQQLVFFLVIDAVICSCCTISLFQFGNTLYRRTCFVCEPYCGCLYNCCYILQRGVRGRKDTILDPLLVDDTVLKNSVHLKETSSPKTGDKNGAILQITNSGMNGIVSVNTTNSSGRKGGSRTKAEVTMLSGFEHVVVKDLEVTNSQLLENRNHSLMSVSEFL